MSRKSSSLFLVVLLASAFAHAANPADVFSLGMAGVATPKPDTLLVAAPLANLTGRGVTDVQITHIQLSSAKLRTSLPIRVNAVREHGSEIVQADFDSKSLVAGKRYSFVLQGTYRLGEGDHYKSPGRPFRVQTVVILPYPSPGSGSVGGTQAPAHKTEGGRYPPRPPRMDNDVNQAAPPVPTTTTLSGTPTRASTETERALLGDPPAVVFKAIAPVGINGAGLGCSGDAAAACAEPSGASGNGVIFVSANWRVAYSTDGGSTFKVLDPTTISPMTPSDTAATRSSNTRLRSTASSGFCRARDTA